MNKIHVWMDVDTGIDDAVAILCAISEDSIIIEGISTVCGNQTVNKTFKNTRNVLSLGGREDIKVFKGKDKPLIQELHTAEYFHGENGLGGAIINDSLAPIEQLDAIDALYNKAKELNGELNIVAVGPLTNIASLLIKYPDVKKYIKALSIMGGSLSNGNITPYAEFNINVDARAAKIVFESGLNIYMCGLDVTQKAIFNIDDCNEIRYHKRKCCKLFNDSIDLPLKNREALDKSNSILMHDACALYFLIHPEWFEYKEQYIYVIDEGERLGQTCNDRKGNNNIKVVIDLDIVLFKNRIKDIYINKLP